MPTRDKWGTIAKLGVGFAIGLIVGNETIRNKVVESSKIAASAVREKVEELKDRHNMKAGAPSGKDTATSEK